MPGTRPGMTKSSKSPALPVLLFDPGRKGREELLQYLLQRFLRQFALLVEGVADAVQIGLGLAHDRSGNARQDVLQSLGCADAAERPRGVGDDADRLAEERAFAVGPRADIDRVLEHARDGAIIFGRHEDDAVRFLQLLAK